MEKESKRERNRGIDYTGVTGRQHKAPQNHPSKPLYYFSPFLSVALSLQGLHQIRSTECQSSTASCHTVIVHLLYACVCTCVNVQSKATSLHTFNVPVFKGTIEEEVRKEVEGMQRTRGGGEALRREERQREGVGNKTEEEVKETGHRASKEKTMGESEGLAQRL